MYRIREVDGDDEHQALADLHTKTFAGLASQAKFDEGYWWLTTLDGHPVAFLGLKQSTLRLDTAYFYRVGVDPAHRGNNLQRRLMRAMEMKARKLGFVQIVTDTRNNPHSANNIAAAGYKMFHPAHPWGHDTAQYWKKDL